jgi:flagellar capping protein FliD
MRLEKLCTKSVESAKKKSRALTDEKMTQFLDALTELFSKSKNFYAASQKAYTSIKRSEDFKRQTFGLNTPLKEFDERISTLSDHLTRLKNKIPKQSKLYDNFNKIESAFNQMKA